MSVDLRNCKRGDKLRIRMIESMVTEWKKTFPNQPQRDIVTYVGPTEENDYMDHVIQYQCGSHGTRTHNGQCFRKNRLPDDMDIMEVM